MINAWAILNYWGACARGAPLSLRLWLFLYNSLNLNGRYLLLPGLLIAVAPRYPYCSDATFTVAVAPILLAESSGDSSAATFLAAF